MHVKIDGNTGAEIMKEWIAQNKDIITSWTATLAAIASTVSIVIAIISMKLQRTHYRKTLLPIGSLSLGDYENELFVRLRNDGAGPMIVDDVSVHRIGKDEKVGSALIDFMPAGLSWNTFVKDIRGRAFAPGKHIDLVAIDGDDQDSQFANARRQVREALSTLSVGVYYQSVYGDKKVVKRSLDWFGRHLKAAETPASASK
jgi:hypothetical protein